MKAAGAISVVGSLSREGFDHVLKGGFPGFLARAAGLFQVHGGLGCV